MSTSKVAMTPEKFKNLVMDLGKPTKRGVRKCPRCGVVNGTRGLTCKNKACEYVFKEGAKKKGAGVDAVKIVTGSTVQVFSVRLRDRGPDYRGFVQLPLVQDLDGNPAENVDPGILASVLGSTAKCYVDTCSRANSSVVGQAVPVCIHIRAAIECKAEARALRLKNSLLNAIQVSSETRQAIWDLATETAGPLVQRVTQNIMVVKCKPTSKHPLGFLHFAFTSPGRMKPGVDAESKFQCSCKEFKTSTGASRDAEKSSERGSVVIRDGRLSYEENADNDEHSLLLLNKEEGARRSKRCLHFYACVCSFASDDDLVKEFAPFIQLAKFIDESGDEPVLARDASSAVEVHMEADEENLDHSTDTQSAELQEITELQAQDGTCTEESLVVESLETPHQFQVIGPSEQVTQSEHDVMAAVGGVLTQMSDGEENLHSSDIDIGHEAASQPDVLTSFSQAMSQADVITQDIISQSDVIAESDVITQNGDIIATSSGDVTFQDENGQSLEVIIDENQQIIAVSRASPEVAAVKRLKMADGTMVVVSEPSDRLAQASSGLLSLHESAATTESGMGEPAVAPMAQAPAADPLLLAKRQITKPAILRHTPKKIGPCDETNTHLSFLQWLSSVTERINQTMHYQFCGIPDPLVFHAPQLFFDCLQARISAGSKKKRLPNHTTGFMRKDALPLGMFTKYTWYITNILHVKQIFDTAEVTVDITRNFVENQDGSFDLVEKSNREKDFAGNDGKNLPIRPFELKTYLKVGHTSPSQKEATPFIIEWIPDILPRSHIGELRIKFEYGHQRNGQLEDRSSTVRS